jgi:soluble lytic murein transglycosylase-like protein
MCRGPTTRARATTFTLLALSFAAPAPFDAHARIVQKVHKDGTVSYVNVPDITPIPLTKAGPLARSTRRYRQLLAQAARKYRLPIALLAAVLETESAGNPRAVSHAGAEGLMQLIPKTQARMGVADPFDPRESVMGGARYLRELADRFDENLVLVVAAYHAGERAVEAAGRRVPSFPTTRQYVTTVMRRSYRAKARARAASAVKRALAPDEPARERTSDADVPSPPGDPKPPSPPKEGP